MSEGFLEQSEFRHLIAIAPLVAIDLIVVDEQNRILVGLRRNRPAQGSWFVPGGRIYKGETVEAAFSRVSEAEIGRQIEVGGCTLLGVYDHIYSDSIFAEDESTHYVTLAYLTPVAAALGLGENLQHSDFRWVSLTQLMQDKEVHANSRAYAAAVESVVGGCAG